MIQRGQGGRGCDLGPLTVRGSGTLPGWFVCVVAGGTPLPSSVGVHDSGFRLESTTVSLTLGHRKPTQEAIDVNRPPWSLLSFRTSQVCELHPNLYYNYYYFEI